MTEGVSCAYNKTGNSNNAAATIIAIWRPLPVNIPMIHAKVTQAEDNAKHI